MKPAIQVLKEERDKPRLTTGNGDLDSLIDGIAPGRFYLFYSHHQEILDLLIHRVLVNCVLPVEKGGFNAKALYFNICNYHRGKTLLDPSTLAQIAKSAGIDPDTAFQNIYAISAFNAVQQTAATKEVVDLLKRDGDIKLIVVHNLTRFIETSRKPLDARRVLQHIVGSLKSTASEKDVTLVVSCSASRTGRRRLPTPLGGHYFRHEANAIIFLDEVNRGGISSVKAMLVKHPYKGTPQSIVLYVPKGGVTLMGRITPSFRQRFHKKIRELRKSSGFRNTLMDLEHKKAFDRLLKEAWSTENAAMSNAGTPCLMDVLNLMANVHNKKSVEENRTSIEDLRNKIQELESTLKHCSKKQSIT